MSQAQTSDQASPQAKYTQGNLMGHIAVVSGTASLGMMAIFLVDLVDMLFISMLGQAELAAAIGYAGSILFFTTSIGIGFAITMGALVSRAIGEGKTDRVRQLMLNVTLISVSICAVFAAVVWIFVPNLLGLLGAEGRTQELATGYLRIIVPSLPILVVGMSMGSVLRARGESLLAMSATIVGGLVNAVLDPIFIFVFDWDLNGAALASVIARIAVFAVAIYPIITRFGGFGRFSAPKFLGDLRVIGLMAVPTILANVATPVGNAYVTSAMAQFGDQAIAGMSVIGRLVPVAFAIMFALSGAIGPIVGQNVGAKRYDRVERAITEAIAFAFGYCLIATLILYLLADQIIGVFGVSGEAAQLVTIFCSWFALSQAFNAALFISNAAFNNLGRPVYATITNWGRHTLGTFPFVMLGSWMFGAPGVLYGQALGGLIFALGACYMAYILVHRLGDEAYGFDPATHKHQWFMPLHAHTNQRG